ncbi:MAG: BamA/TamA family outer membrane protein [Elainella sp. C42_A2020_010]|nr:BamA/TamA family outer membrane protein [Elainella sp. C42_A2020_010]
MSTKQTRSCALSLAIPPDWTPVLTALLGVGLPLVFVDKSNAELPIPKPSVLYYSWETAPSDATSTDRILADTPAELDVAPELAPAETASETDSTIREPLPIDFSTDAPLPDASSNSAADLTAPETTSQTPPASQPEEDSEPETAEPPVQVEFTPAGPSLLFDGIAPAGSGQTITDIEVRFFRRNGEIFEGHTRPSVFLREFDLEPGTPYDEVLAQQGLDRLSRMAVVRSAGIELEPAANPDEAVMVILVEERSPIVLGLYSVNPSPSALEGPFQQNPALGQGPDENTGLSADGSVRFLNLGGNDQELTLQIRGGVQVFDTELAFRDPWIGNDPTGISFNIFNQRSVQRVFAGGARDVDLPNRNTPWVHRFGGGVEVFRPVATDLTLALGVNYQQVSIHNSAFERDTFDRDQLGERLIVGSDFDELLTVQFSGELNRLDNLDRPLDGDRLRFGIDQAIPIGAASITYTRLSANYTHFLPLDLFGFAEGPRTLVFNVQAGAMFGDVPPYDAFSIEAGPLGSYAGDGLASGSRFALVAAEYRFPIINFELLRRDVNLGGAIFSGFASTLGSADDVIGEPSVSRRKPEDGFVFGLGLRADTDLGLFRLEFSINDDGASQVVLTAGEKF